MGSAADRIGRRVVGAVTDFTFSPMFEQSDRWAFWGSMPDFWDTRPDEISTDEVLRAGQAQLESSRAVLHLMDDALRKGAEIVAAPRPATGADDEILLIEERRSDRLSPHDARRS